MCFTMVVRLFFLLSNIAYDASWWTHSSLLNILHFPLSHSFNPWRRSSAFSATSPRLPFPLFLAPRPRAPG